MIVPQPTALKPGCYLHCPRLAAVEVSLQIMVVSSTGRHSLPERGEGFNETWHLVEGLQGRCLLPDTLLNPIVSSNGGGQKREVGTDPPCWPPSLFGRPCWPTIFRGSLPPLARSLARALARRTLPRRPAAPRTTPRRWSSSGSARGPGLWGSGKRRWFLLKLGGFLLCGGGGKGNQKEAAYFGSLLLVGTS